MARVFGMLFGCVIAAGLLALGLHVAPGVDMPVETTEVPSVPVPEPVPVVTQEQPAALPGPSVDVLRVERDGATLVSGRATPGAEVEIRMDDVPTGRASADAQGNFVAFLTLPESDAPQSLNLLERQDGGEVRTGTESFIVETRRPSKANPLPSTSASAETEPSDDLAGSPESLPSPVTDFDVPRRPDASSDASDDDLQIAEPSDTGNGPVSTRRPAAPGKDGAPAEGPSLPPSPDVLMATLSDDGAPVSDAEPMLDSRSGASPETDLPPQPEAPRVMRVEEGGLSIVQDGAPNPALSIDTIRYAPDGTVVLGGRAPRDTSIRAYLDDRSLAAVQSSRDGQWRLDMPALDQKTYRLRVDQLDAGGEIVARAETPFRPETVERLDELRGMVEDGVRRVTVQPGFTLWAIAERNYGDGMSFVRVFEANSDKIRDADLIYPGQIFAVPD